MLEELGLKEKNSLFHQYVFNHIKIGQDPTHPLNEAYASKYTSWKIQFNYCHGELDSQRGVNVPKLACTFNIKLNEKDDVFKFIFAVDAFYISLLTLCAARTLDQNYAEEKFENYISLSYFKEARVGNYFVPSDIFQGTACLNIYDCLFSLAIKLKTINLNAKSNVDLIREVFHEVYPKEIRHSLGEFYTPDWMAQYIVEANTKNLQDGVILDPTCGSGTFLLATLNYLRSCHSDQDFLQKILGFDINPVSVFAAKTNLIINLSRDKLVDQVLPIFNANILDYEQDSMGETSTYDKALSEIKKICLNENKEYSEIDILKLEKIGLKVPKLSKERASLAIGNPPWVNWEYLPTNYRERYKLIWQDYGLFDYKGINSIFIKEDISSLITYVTINHYLRNNGHISFVVKESLFKSIKQAAGFRKFYIESSGIDFKINLLEDLTGFNPFKGVSNNTVIFHATKGERTSYPVKYKTWIMKPKSTFQDTDNFETVKALVNANYMLAIPSNPEDQTSGWASIDEGLYKSTSLLTGTSAYKARTGVFTGGANGIYWLNILEKVSRTTAFVENITERAKIKFKQIKMEIENDILFPYASGSDIRMWSYTYKKYIVCPHTAETKMYPIPFNKMEISFPLATKFFKTFEVGLKERKGFTSFDKKIHEAHFYTLQRIGEYTFCKYKVAWKYISSEFICAVIQDVDDKFLGRKTIIPNEKIIYVGLDDKDEAYYLCGLLSSSYIRNLINSFKVSTQIAPSTISNLNLPKYDKDNPLHNLISSICAKGHKDLKNIDEYIMQIDQVLFDAISPSGYKNRVALPAGIGLHSKSGA